MTLTLTGTKTAPDAYDFTVAGVDPIVAPTFVIDYGDGSAPVTTPTHASGTTVVHHVYTVAGHHDYTVWVTAARTAFASTLVQLANLGQPAPPPQSMFPSSTTAGQDAADYQWGYRFSVVRDGQITALKFYRIAAQTSTSRAISLWDATGTIKLAEVVTSGETGTGWKSYQLATPYQVKAGTDYVVAYRTVDFVTYLDARFEESDDLQWVVTMYSAWPNPPSQSIPDNPTFAAPADVVFEPFTSHTLTDLANVPGYTTLASWPATSDTVTLPVSVDVGAATIWATVVAGSPIPAVQVDTYLSGGQSVIAWEISRDVAGASTTIYVGSAWQQAVSFVDALAPLGVPVVYRLRITYADYTSVYVSSNTVTITGTSGCYLTDPNTGVTVGVTLVTWPEREREARRAVLSVLNRADPVTLSDLHRTPAGDWTFYTATDADTLALLTLLTASTFATLRTQPGSSIASVTVSVGTINERRYSGRGGDPRRLVDVEVQEIEPLPATALPLNATLGGLAVVDGDTLGELSLLRDTLLQLSMVVTGTADVVDARNV